MIMKKPAYLLSLCILVMFTHIKTSGQVENDSTQFEIETKDGNTYVGRILSQDDQIIQFKTDNIGEITIQKSQVQKMTVLEADRVKNGKVWKYFPQTTRYFWGSSGYGMKAGEGYYQNVWVFFNQFSFSISDNISMGAGIMPIFLLGSDITPVWVTPKFSLPIVENKFNVGGGALMGTMLGGEKSGFGFLYGTTTLGSRDKNVTMGLGYGYAAGDFAKSPTINLSTMLRTGPRGYFISENYYISTGNSYLIFISLGGRGLTRSGVGIDYGIVLPVDDFSDEFVAIPWLGITLPFKPKN